MPSTHPAAILPQKGGPLVVADRTTPEPGPNEVLIEVKAVALNPVDWYQRDKGFPPVPVYPAVIGGDVAGIVAKVGTDATVSPPPGSRILALATSFYSNGSPDHGAFQKFTLAPAEAVITLPEDLTFEQGAAIPLGLLTALSAWTTIDLPIETNYAPEEKQAVLIWGGASSVGTFAIQTAKALGFTVYTTASQKHHQYLKSLGAHATFDYRASDVVAQIVGAVKRDGVKLHTAHCVVDGGLQPTLDILKETKGDAAARVAYAPVLPDDHPTLDNTIIRFVNTGGPEQRNQHLYNCFHKWTAPRLNSKGLVSSPALSIEAGGLQGVNAALDKLRGGVSGLKVVVPI